MATSNNTETAHWSHIFGPVDGCWFCTEAGMA